MSGANRARQIMLCIAAVGAMAFVVTRSPNVAQAQSGSSDTSAHAKIDARADALLARMTLEHKVAQIIQPDISTITPDDVLRYRFGSILNGGNSGPGGNDRASASAYLELADAFWSASTAPLENGEPAIPVMWATDAVHGDNNIIGATLYPHNIGLGAANDPALTRRIGAATAQEIATTGLDWAFAPTLAIARDARWGRTYESFSENPAIAGRLGAALIEGLQGRQGTTNFLDQRHVLATAKHFFGDGGTGGIDRGDTRGKPDDLLRVHAAPYRPAIAAGVQTVMASFSSVNGVRMHGNTPILTGLLHDQMKFDGLVVGDWNGHATIPGCTNADCPAALLAGLDIYMVPEDWRALYASLLREVKDGSIPMARLDQAVRRVLRVKLRYGLFDKPRPSQRALAGKFDLIGAPDHRALARDAVRRSLVLLKNRGVLPIRANAYILVAGSAANSIARQSGGWSVSWQGGGDLTNADFPGATSIFAGIERAANAAGGSARYSADGRFAKRPDVAIIVFGEQPYAEFIGDRPDHALHDEEGLRLLRRFRAAHIPTVAVLLSGRPLWTNRELAAADAFVAAWLPGSEGDGVADVLIGSRQGKSRYDFAGRLSFHWPAHCRDQGTPLLGVGGGSSYASPPRLPRLDLGCAALTDHADGATVLFDRALGSGIAAEAQAAGIAGAATLPGLIGSSEGGAVLATAVDFKAQEDSRRIEWRGAGIVTMRTPAAIEAERRVLTIGYAALADGNVRVAGLCDDCRLATALPTLPRGTQQVVRIPLGCFGVRRLNGIRLIADRGALLRLTTASIDPSTTSASCPAMGPITGG